MVTTIAAFAIASASGYQSSGMPTCVGNAHSVHVVIHSVKFNITDEGVDVSSLTLFKSDSDKAVTCQLSIPAVVSDGGDTMPPAGIHGTWDKQTMRFTRIDSVDAGASALNVGSARAMISFEPRGTHALRLHFRVQPGATGYENVQRQIVYALGGSGTWSGPIEKFDVAFTYSQREVFGLPSLTPKWAWQVGQTGAFIRRENFSADSGVGAISIVYYPGGF